MTFPRHRIAWSTSRGVLLAIEPDPEEVARYAGALAAAYNIPHNAALLGHSELLGEADVIAHYDSLSRSGHGFLMFRDGELAGDGDLRGVTDRTAEFAFLIAAVSAQGQGLGTQLATMIHSFAFAWLGLERVYASILPSNVASRRVFEKLGYAIDSGPEARAYADDPDDITMVVERATFEQSHALAMAEIQIAVR